MGQGCGMESRKSHLPLTGTQAERGHDEGEAQKLESERPSGLWTQTGCSVNTSCCGQIQCGHSPSCL